ncbi:IucA/IucC family C-terminal-domain containing protein [Microbulbifer taiwanensis]|uniref:IucA/IucC family C-terminal-domain containing protein n=1 Tax=Microbulbifer taiwanensis TaxID=986746 RepID=UPI00361A26C8
MIEILKPIFRGPLATYGQGLACSEAQPPGTIRLQELLGTTDALETLLYRQADFLGTGDLRPVASAWMLQYTALLVPPVAVAATVLGHVFPVGYRDAAVDIDGRGLPRRIIVPHSGRSAVGQNTACRYATLFAAHLTPWSSACHRPPACPARSYGAA